MTLVGRFLTGTYTVQRKAPGTYKGGFYLAGADQNLSMQGSLQPTNARELKLPEEGARLRQYFKFYSDQPLLTINTKNLAGADTVVINGDTYKVMSIESWAGTDIPYFMSILSREPEQ